MHVKSIVQIGQCKVVLEEDRIIPDNTEDENYITYMYQWVILNHASLRGLRFIPEYQDICEGLNGSRLYDTRPIKPSVMTVCAIVERMMMGICVQLKTDSVRWGALRA